jgi:cytochrome c peroxidase
MSLFSVHFHNAALAALLLTLCAACSPHDSAAVAIDAHGVVGTCAPEASHIRREPIAPIPLSLALDARKVALGKKLFHEPKLSRDNSISCASCHDLRRAGTDHLPRSVGLGHAHGAVSAPTVFNSGFNFRQFWDGRAESLEAQVDGPLQSPSEMGANWDDVLAMLRRDSAYAAEFRAVYPGGVTREHVRDAIGEFERSLTTPNSRFDRYLRGDDSALSAEERAGYAKFKNYGCISCHQGVNIGANMFQRMGAIGDYFADRGHVTDADYGRFNVTKNETDKFFFKVPSLRNVAVTAPYFHDGSAQTLPDAVAVMAKYQLGRSLAAEDLNDIVAFLQTLTGEYEGRPLQP